MNEERCVFDASVWFDSLINKNPHNVTGWVQLLPTRPYVILSWACHLHETRLAFDCSPRKRAIEIFPTAPNNELEPPVLCHDLADGWNPVTS